VVRIENVECVSTQLERKPLGNVNGLFQTDKTYDAVPKTDIAERKL